MYLSNIKLWNFRKYGLDADLWLTNSNYLERPNLDLNFTKWLNVLIWANDSWKTAILDAIKLVLKTNSYEWIKVTDEDFYVKDDSHKSTKFRIELTFSELEDNFSRFFPEHLTVEWEWDDITESLNLVFEVFRNKERIFPTDVKVGKNWELWTLSAEQRELLNITYLKPLRDVKSEFIPKKNSRLSNIFDGDIAFKDKKSHLLMWIFNDFNSSIEKYFEWINSSWTASLLDRKWKLLKEKIDNFVREFIDKDTLTEIWVSKWELKNILEKLELWLAWKINPGLWSLNRLFIASELLHLQRNNYDWLELWLIEEIEAHIHPQAQMKVIESLDRRVKNKWIQLILTTHSPNLASKVKLENLIICENNYAFPMGDDYTNLWTENYRFLERFLDVTKSNLFFSEWVIFVEWWAEEIILPTFTRLLKKLQIIEKDLTDSQTEIVNVWSDSFFRYSQIFERISEPYMSKRVAIVTDIDLRPDAYRNNSKIREKLVWKTNPDDIKTILKKCNIISWYNATEIEEERNQKNLEGQCIKTYLTDDNHWTLEYALWVFPKFQQILFESIKKSIIDMRNDPSTTYSSWIESRDFSALVWTNEEKAFEIYNNIMLKKKVSKPIVAQYFTEFLENEIKTGGLWIVASDFDNSPVSYLINAIKYATNQ